MADSLVKAESPLLQEILADIKAAMKAHDSVTLEVLRTLHSDIKNVAINAKKDVTDDIVLDVLAKSIKQRNESIEMLCKGGREENAQDQQHPGLSGEIYRRKHTKSFCRSHQSMC